MRRSRSRAEPADTRLVYDEAARSLSLDGGEPVVLRAKSFGAFLALAGSFPEPLSKDALIDTVWGKAAVSDDSVTQCIADIRRALGDKDHRLVQTVPGEGYRLTEAAAPAATASAEPETVMPPPWHKAIAAGIVLALMAAGGAAWWQMRPDAPAPPAALQDDALALGVLRFETLADDQDLGRFAQGLGNDIVVGLGAFDTLSVLSPSAVGTASGPTEAVVEAYRQRGAAYVVAGTVQPGPDKVRVSVRLIDTATAELTWVRRWEREAGDLLAAQDRIAQAVVSELANPWSGVLAQRPAPGADLDVQDHIRLGAEQFAVYTPDSLASAEGHFRAATTLDPDSAEAWAGQALALGALLPLADPQEIEQMKRARADAGRRAYHIDPLSGRALLAGSYTACQRGNRRQCEARLTGAVAAAPGDGDVLAAAALAASLNTELYSEALDWGTRALEQSEAPPDWYHIGPGLAALFMDDPARAADHLHNAPQGHALVLAFLSAAEALRDTPDPSAAAHARLRMLDQDFTVERLMAAETLHPEDKAEVIRAAMARAGLRME